MPYLPIDPQERLDYSFDWRDFLDEAGSPGDTIATAAFAIEPQNDGSPDEPVLSGAATSTTSASVFVANCAVGIVYRLTCRVTTAAGRVAERSVTLRCEQL